jgi:hypothetical protein
MSQKMLTDSYRVLPYSLLVDCGLRTDVYVQDE